MKSKKNLIRTIIVDDHQIFLEALQITLGRYSYFKVLKTFKNGDGVLDFVLDNQIDVVIMDIQMPGINGLDLSRQILNVLPETTIVILTMLDSLKIREQAHEIGVTHFLFKGDNLDGLLNAMNHSQSGNLFIKIPERKTSSFTRREYLQSDQFGLTIRELEVFELIIEGLDNHEIGTKLFVSQLTIKTHRANIFKKTDRKNSVELVALWHSLGTELE